MEDHLSGVLSDNKPLFFEMKLTFSNQFQPINLEAIHFILSIQKIESPKRFSEINQLSIRVFSTVDCFLSH